MSDSWYYVENDTSRGPVSLEELRKILATQPNWQSVLVWKEGFQDWTPAGSAVFPPPVRKAEDLRGAITKFSERPADQKAEVPAEQAIQKGSW
jgi:hypothetical protein